MSQQSENLNDPEFLRNENAFLKMKMMLEHGAHFGSCADLPPEMENAFLKNIMAVEKQFESGKKIKLYDRIEKPTIFKAVDEIADEEIEGALDSLLEWLYQYNIQVDVCSPNVTLRELYRFITEELFEYEMDDMAEAGWVSNFIYDQFHADPVYENQRTAVAECLGFIISKKDFKSFAVYQEENIRLNDNYPIDENQLTNLVNNFKAAYDHIVLTEVSDVVCEVLDNTCVVSGKYTATLSFAGEEIVTGGDWLIGFVTDDNYYWSIDRIEIAGIKF